MKFDELTAGMKVLSGNVATIKTGIDNLEAVIQGTADVPQAVVDAFAELQTNVNAALGDLPAA